MKKMTEREKFEKWYRENFDNSVIDDSEFSEILNEYESNYYWVDELNLSWKAWQAAKADAVPEGYVLLPKEPTGVMLEAGMGNFDFPLDNGRFSNHDLIFAYKAMIEAQEQENV